MPGMTIGGSEPPCAEGGAEVAPAPTVGWDAAAPCVVALVFAAVATAEFPFVCTITGLAPGLSTAIGMAKFTG
jgi:hypothetical protein